MDDGWWHRFSILFFLLAPPQCLWFNRVLTQVYILTEAIKCRSTNTRTLLFFRKMIGMRRHIRGIEWWFGNDDARASIFTCLWMPVSVPSHLLFSLRWLVDLNLDFPSHGHIMLIMLLMSYKNSCFFLPSEVQRDNGYSIFEDDVLGFLWLLVIYKSVYDKLISQSVGEKNAWR